jgi:hypothetical protein
MRAAVTTGSSIEVRDDVPDPRPGPAQRAASIGVGSEPPRAAIFEADGKPGMIPQAGSWSPA